MYKFSNKVPIRPHLHQDSADGDGGRQEPSCHGGNQRPPLNGVLEERPQHPGLPRAASTGTFFMMLSRSRCHMTRVGQGLQICQGFPKFELAGHFPGVAPASPRDFLGRQIFFFYLPTRVQGFEGFLISFFSFRDSYGDAFRNKSVDSC